MELSDEQVKEIIGTHCETTRLLSSFVRIASKSQRDCLEEQNKRLQLEIRVAELTKALETKQEQIAGLGTAFDRVNKELCNTQDRLTNERASNMDLLKLVIWQCTHCLAIRDGIDPEWQFHEPEQIWQHNCPSDSEPVFWDAQLKTPAEMQQLLVGIQSVIKQQEAIIGAKQAHIKSLEQRPLGNNDVAITSLPNAVGQGVQLTTIRDRIADELTRAFKALSLRDDQARGIIDRIAVIFAESTKDGA